jgi:hypothetical protein
VALSQFQYNSTGDQAYYSGWNYDTAQRVAGPGYPIASSPYFTGSRHNDLFGGVHPGLCLFALADGHVTGLSTSIDLVNLGRLAVRNDGQVITADH